MLLHEMWSLEQIHVQNESRPLFLCFMSYKNLGLVWNRRYWLVTVLLILRARRLRKSGVRFTPPGMARCKLPTRTIT